MNPTQHPLIDRTRTGAVLFLSLNRPDRANAYNRRMLDALGRSLDEAEKDPEIRVLILTGKGPKHFCAGADLDELKNRSPLENLDLAGANIFRRIAGLAMPTIAAVNGDTVGGGLELALACDLRLASKNARFWFPETALGIIPAAGGAHRLARFIGLGRAKEMILTRRRIDAATALEWGLVNEVVDGDLLPRAMALAEELAKTPPKALALAKQVIDAGFQDGPGFFLSRLVQTELAFQGADKGQVEGQGASGKGEG